MVHKVIATPAALELIEVLKAKHGPLMFHQSGGCCDNSAANCYLPGEITIGAQDEYLGDIGGCPPDRPHKADLRSGAADLPIGGNSWGRARAAACAARAD